MSLPEPQPRVAGIGIPLTLAELFGQMRIKGFNANGDATKLLLETDGTLRAQSILYHSGTTQIRQKAETDGTVMVSNYGKAASTLTAMEVNARGGQLVEHQTPTTPVVAQLEPAAATESTLYTATGVVKVEKFVVANRSTTTTFILGIAVGGGSLADEDHLFDTAPIQANTTVMIDGPFYLTNTDVVRVESASGNVAFSLWGIS